MTGQKRKLAIFDIDGTIYRWSLFLELVYELIKAGVFPKKVYKELLEAYLLWIDRKAAFPEYLEKVVAIYYRHIKGKKERDIHRVAKRILTKKRDRVYTYTKSLITDLRKRGYYLVAISGSPDYLVHDFARYFGFHEYYGSQFETKNGVFTGGIKNISSAIDKKAILKHFFRKHEGRFDLKTAVGVGDTEMDIPILRAVGQPLAFNPNRKLATEAKKRGWKIIVERKDVVYDLKKFDFLRS